MRSSSDLVEQHIRNQILKSIEDSIKKKKHNQKKEDAKYYSDLDKAIKALKRAYQEKKGVHS